MFHFVSHFRTFDAHCAQFLNGKRVTADQPYRLHSGYRIILGEHHVFRFNNPEEVRKQRDRQRAATLSIANLGELGDGEPSGNGTPITRPDSPLSYVAEIDYNFAKREAALRLAGLDPDNMPDEELDKLYEKITKVKTLRGRRLESRPESSMSLSQMDDVWSEMGRLPVAQSEAMTDDTSIVDGNGNITLTPGGDDSAPSSAKLKEMQTELEAQKAEFETRLQAIGEASEAEDLKIEKEHMQHQLALVQTQMKRLLQMRARGDMLGQKDIEIFEPVVYTAKQLRIIRKVLDKWRAHRAFSMAQSVLSNAVVIKEANIIRQVKPIAQKNQETHFPLARSWQRTYPTILPLSRVDLWPLQCQHWKPLLA